MKEFQPKDVNQAGQAFKEATKALSGAAETTDPTAFRAPLFAPVFSRRREVFIGRLAMIGFPVSLIWEALLPNHPGPLGQITQLTGLPQQAVAILFGAILVQGIVGLLPGSLTYSRENQQDIRKRPAGPPFTWINPVREPTNALGVSRWGFTKKNELFNSRLVMIGFLMACVNEITTGGLGALGQVGKFASISLDDHFYTSTCLTLFAAWTVITGGLALLSGNWGQLQGDDEIY